MKDIITAITATLRTVSSKVHFLDISDEALLTDHSIVYTLTNVENESTIDNPELIKNWDCLVRINSAKITKTNYSNEVERVLNLYQPVKNAMYALPVSYIKCTYEDFFKDNNLEIYTQILRFQIKTS